MTKIDIDKFICDFISTKFTDEDKEEIKHRYWPYNAYSPIYMVIKAIGKALESQGLTYKDGKIVEIDQPPLTEEQKPKFKVGDWIVDYLGSTLQIIGVYSSYYRIKEYSQRIYSWDSKNAERDSHIWTIQDAKDGDVLSYRNGQWIFILKALENNNSIIEYYTLLSEDGLSIKDAASTVLISSITPATKEQRDFLFQKMEEAGYKWNQEELKLEKIDKPQTIKFNEPLTNAEKRYFDKMLFDDVRYKPFTLKKEDIDKMVEEYRETLDSDSHLIYTLKLVSSYRKGLEDMLKVIKEGGE